MVHRQRADALAAYEATLAREPNRARTLTGAACAAAATGRRDAAAKYYRMLIDLMDQQSPRPELAEARAFVAVR
jgi:hypothetical protein